MCHLIPGYNRRFDHPQGLIGVAQVFTPHGTSKRIRSRLDNWFYTRPRTIRADAGLLLLTAWAFAESLMRRAFLLSVHAWRRVTGHPVARQSLTRKRPRNATVHAGGGGAEGCSADLIDISEKNLRFRSVTEWDRWPDMLELRIKCRRSPGRTVLRRARCRAKLLQVRKTSCGRVDHVVGFEPVGDVDEYVVLQYFLKSSLACRCSFPYCMLS
jgi:hypothetical protein